jgi:hypothetical protein
VKTVDIPGGQATLREKQDIKVRHRRLIEAAGIEAAPLLAKLPNDQASKAALTESQVLALGISKQEANSLFELGDATIVAALAAWTLPDPLPTLATIGDLDPELYEALSTACAQLGADLTQETFEPPPPGSPGFEASPTEPSDASDSDSEGTERSESTDVPPSSGPSTSSASPSQG